MSVLLAVIFGALSLVGYGISDYLASLSSKRIGSFETVIISRAVSLIILIAAFLLFFQFPVLTIFEIELLLITTFFTMVGLLSFYKGFAVGDVSIVASIGNSCTAVTVILLLLFLKATLTTLESICIVAIIAGTILTSFKLKDLHKLDPRKAVKGSGYAVLSMLAWGVSLFLGVILIGYLGWFFPVLFIYAILLVYNLIYFFARGIKFKSVGNTILPATSRVFRWCSSVGRARAS